MRRLFCILFAIVLLASCVNKEETWHFEEGRPVDVELHFGPCDALSVGVATKSTLGVVQESRVNNMYVFIFDGNGKKIYGHFFDGNNYGEAPYGSSDWWEVTNMASESDPATHGTIHLKTMTKSGCTIIGIANVDVNQLDLSPGQLSTIQKLQQLEQIKVGLNQTGIENSGYFLMTGRMNDVDIVDDPDKQTQEIEGTLVFRRLESKVQFNVRVAQGSPIANFTLTKWELVNQPKTSYLLERGSFTDNITREDSGVLASDFIRSGELNYESQTVTGDFYSGSNVNHIISYGFSFYMMENRFAPIQTPTTYQDRERQTKNNEVNQGEYSTVENGEFIYADPRSAYVIIKGKIVMDVTSSEAGNKLDADVQYIVHLGDFASSVADFNIFRNHNYIYNIYINSVDDIVAEVEINYDEDPTVRLQENEPGATGRVVVALEEVYTTDAHYNSHVISFHAKHLDPDNITWYVETPFNPKGARPTIVDGAEYTDGIDYEWVEFRVNDMGTDGLYKQNRQIYKPITDAGTMNVTQLVSFLKRQRLLYEQDRQHAGEVGYVKRSLFDNETEDNDGPKISVTAFVNEYYYETDPLEPGKYVKDLWRQFVNKPMRYMHILSMTKRSADYESTTLGAIITIQQKSIQSIYNISNPDLQSAWGVEFSEDENESGATIYWKGWKAGKISEFEDRGNTSTTNGRLNTLKEWKMLNADGSILHLGQEGDDLARWDTYVNLTAKNDEPLLRRDAEVDYRYLRYSCMSRNRDNNGNGIIDPEEVRWYMGADTQLMGLFLGSYGIEGDARLYQKSAEDIMSDDRNVWRQHVVASTLYPDRNNSNINVRCIWAEEGLCGSDLSFYSTSDGSTDVYTTRCVRNLGYFVQGGQERDITYADPDVDVDPFIRVTRMHREATGSTANYTGNYDSNTYYDFDCSRLNSASLREYVDHELVAHDEDNKAACLPVHFVSIPASESIPVPTSIEFNGVTYDPRFVRQMNQYLDATWGIKQNPFCPRGYRLCNVREDALLWNFIPRTDMNYFSNINNHSRTHWTFGVDGVHPKTGLTSWGWSISKVKILMANVHRDDQRASAIRCVKDVEW